MQEHGNELNHFSRHHLFFLFFLSNGSNALMNILRYCAVAKAKVQSKTDFFLPVLKTML